MASFSDILSFLQTNSGLLAEPGSPAYNEQEMSLYEAGAPVERNLNSVFPQSLVDSIERVQAERRNVIDPYSAAIAPIDAQIRDLRTQLPQFRTTRNASQAAVIENQISELEKQKENLRVQTIPKLQAERSARASGLPTQIVGPNMYATDINVPLAPETKAGESLRQGIDLGTSKAREQNQGLLSQQQEQGFFGNIGDYINEDFLGRVLAIMARPEAFTDPRGLGAGIARAGQAVFAQEKEQAAAAAKKKLEYDKIQADLQKEAIKAGKRPEFKQFMAKMVTDVRQQKQGLDTVQKIKRLLGDKGAGGIAGAFESFVSDAGAIFGASGGQSVNQQIEKYNAYLLSSLGSGIASGQISQEDYKRIDAMLKAPGITTDAGKLLDAYNEVERVIGGAYKTNADMLREVGYGQLIEPSVARDRGIQVPD